MKVFKRTSNKVTPSENPPKYVSGCPSYRAILAEKRLEKPPKYTPSINKHCIMKHKPELDSPHLCSMHRTWRPIYVHLNNTQLNLYELIVASSSKPLFSPNSSNYTPDALELSGTKHSPDLVSPSMIPSNLTGTVLNSGACKIGKLLHSYTLQYAEVGLAIDYKKRPHVFRIRAEGEQFLLQTCSAEDQIGWVNSLQIGIDISLPIDDRSLPKYHMIPRRRRRGAPPLQVVVEVTRPPPALVPGIHVSIDTKKFRSPSPVPSIDKIDDLEEKCDMWEPRHPKQSTQALLKYAFQCLRVLPASTSWLGKPVIVEGKKYVVKETALKKVSLK